MELIMGSQGGDSEGGEEWGAPDVYGGDESWGLLDPAWVHAARREEMELMRKT